MLILDEFSDVTKSVEKNQNGANIFSALHIGILFFTELLFLQKPDCSLTS